MVLAQQIQYTEFVTSTVLHKGAFKISTDLKRLLIKESLGLMK